VGAARVVPGADGVREPGEEGPDGLALQRAPFSKDRAQVGALGTRDASRHVANIATNWGAARCFLRPR
jgi:hypothetical protein